MKKLISVFVLLVSTSAFSGEITLTGGSKALINANDPTLVKCEGSDGKFLCYCEQLFQAPDYKIAKFNVVPTERQPGGNYYILSVGYDNQSDCIAAIKNTVSCKQ